MTMITNIDLLLQEGLTAAQRWIQAKAGSAEAHAEADRAATALVAIDCAIRAGAPMPQAWRPLSVQVDEPGETIGPRGMWPRQGGNGAVSGAGGGRPDGTGST